MLPFQESDPGENENPGVDKTNASEETLFDDYGSELVSKPMNVVITKSLLTSSATPKISAPNMIVNGQCCCCMCDIDVSTHGIQCFGCKNFYHATGCSDDANCVAAPSVFTNQLLPATNKTRGFEKRFGCFFFMCNYCITEKEKLSCVTQDDRVNILEKKLDNMQDNFKEELSAMKSLLTDLSSKKSSELSTTSPSNLEVDNPWNDMHKVDHLRHMMVIKKDNQGNSVDKSVLEKVCVDDGVSVLNSFEMKKSGDTAIIVQSKAEADVLRSNLNNTLPQHQIEQVSARTPTINVVGLIRDYGKDELVEMIKKQNIGIKSIFESDTSDDDKKLDIVAVTPLKSNPSRYKAIIRVSNLIRSVIAKQSDRIYVGSQPVCKVYDNFYVLRCYQCQGFGHHSKDCKNSVKCGFCAANHETRSCLVKSDPSSASCSNCVDSKSSDHKHPANDPNCPHLVSHQEKLRKTIPFYLGRQ